MKKSVKLISTIIGLIMLGSTFALAGCNDNQNENQADTTLAVVQELGYLEDFGNEINITSQLKEGLNREQHGDIESNYIGVEINLGKRIFLSHLGMPAGDYTAKIGDKNLGKIKVSQQGEANLTALPKGLTMGDKYELTCTTTWGKPYTQTIRLVSRAIDDQDEYVNMINYYSLFTKRQAGTCDCEVLQVNQTSPCPHINPGKFYDGENFTQRLYVLDKNIYVTQETKWLGINGIMPPSGQKYVNKDPFANLQSLSACYFFDKFDGQGHTVAVEELHDYGMFGNIASIAEVKNFAFNLPKINTYGWDNYYGTGPGYKQDSMEVFTTRKNFLAGTISSGAVVENIAIYTTMEAWTMYGLNAIAGVIKEGAVLKDIYLCLPDTLTFGASNHTNHPGGVIDPPRLDVHEYLSGIIGYGCELDVIDNFLVISPHMDYAYYTEIDGELVKMYAENSNEDNYVQGMYLFTNAEMAINSGYGKVGSWSINTNGSATYSDVD